MAKRNHFRNTQKRQYRSQAFRNPYFQSKQLTLRHLIILSLVGVVGTLVLVVFLLRNDRFFLKDVTISGASIFSRERFEQTIRDYFQKQSLFVFNNRHQFFYRAQDLTLALSEQVAFESINLKREKQTLTITVVEKQSQMIWASGEQRYVVDLEGKIIRELTEEERSFLTDTSKETDIKEMAQLRTLPLFIDRNHIPVTVGSSVLTSQEITNIFDFHKQLQEHHIGMKNTQVDRVAGKWIAVETTDGYQILFDATGDIPAQISRLELILKEKVSDVSRLTYIDLRFGDHVYFQ